MTKAEQYIQDCTRHCSNEIIVSTPDGNSYTKDYESWLTPDQARRAVEISKEDLIDKACKWLNNFYSEERHCYLVKEDIEAFIKAMEE